MIITEKHISRWLRENEPSVYYLRQSQKSLNKNLALRDLGKLFADPNEHIQKDWINENTSLNVVQRDDFEDDSNASGFDLCTTDDVLKIQSKLRAVTFHLEQTRRKSEKNKNSSDTGHVRYSVGEADVYLFSRPNVDDYTNINKWEFIAIPESELIDPKNTDYLIPRVPKKIWINFVGKAKEILEKEYNRKK
tara:strand:+ start:144 stop:719 length:576 start_codon:yes stop_codon:yes gene_type:complete